MKHPNKRRERTEQLKMAQRSFLMNEQAQNDIEQYNFNKLVKTGIIIKEADPHE